MRRAFIIAIENYTDMQEILATSLPGTHQAAAAFHDWLLNDHGLQQKHIYFCTDDTNAAGRTTGATFKEIVAELRRLKKEGKDQTDELYCFFIGHGLCYSDVPGARPADVIPASDYRDRSQSGNECVRIDELQQSLRIGLGPRDHFYFIDCCRNLLKIGDIDLGKLGIGWDSSKLGQPTVYTLYSTIQGATAAVGSGFPAALIEALKGTGRAKVWRGPNMAVVFDSVKSYVEAKLPAQPIDQRKEGSRDGVILEISPPPKKQCEVIVTDSAPADVFTVKLGDYRGRPIHTDTFTGPRWSSLEEPDDYTVTADLAGRRVAPLDPLPADLYEDCTVHFAKQPPSAAGAGPPATPTGPTAGDDIAADQRRDRSEQAGE